jgi:transketolase C-terminal domain/subunit
MRKFLYAIAAIALLAEPVVAMPVDPMRVAPTVSDGQIMTAAYGHYRRMGRRTMRRVYRRHHYY